MRVSVIFTTYNSPEWLEKVLWGFDNQSFKDFEIIIADDGSGPDTKQKILSLQDDLNLDIQHIWQPDLGFQKTVILNKAILKSRTDYLIFTDGDCIPRSDFVKVHHDMAEVGYFLSGGYFKLPMSTSKIISKSDILCGNAFDKEWLISHGTPNTYKFLKLTSKGWLEDLLNKLTPAGAPWNGHNASGWKSDIMATNGFNEEMQYGSEDRELGERLFNLGIRSKQIRYSAICVHLDHERGYATRKSIEKNMAIRKSTKRNKITWTVHGIVKSEGPETH